MSAAAPQPRFDGRAAIVTGAGKGPGRAYALWLAAGGCAVVVNNRSGPNGSSSARAVVAEIEAAGGRAVAHDGPVEQEESAAAMAALALDAFGRLDILICNAGIQRWRDFAQADLAELRSIIDINLWGTLLPLKAVWPHMVAQRYGRIVLTGSSAGLWGQKASVGYAASKAAMVGIGRSLALDVPEGCDIHANVVAPAAYTNMSADVIDRKWKAFLLGERVAPVVEWLASEACGISGAIVRAAAGRMRRVQILESARVDTGEDLGSTLNQLALPGEPTTGFASGAELMPEIFAGLTGTVHN